MSQSLVHAYVIGQTPRPDLTTDLQRRFPDSAFQIVGALDGMRSEEVVQANLEHVHRALDGYPLETRLRDGTRVVVDAAFVEGRLQVALEGPDVTAVADPAIGEPVREPDAHLILCAGPFPGLVEPTTTSGGGSALIRPFDVAVTTFRARGFHRLDVLVPFRDQAAPAAAKWTSAGFVCRTRILSERPRDLTLSEWASEWVEHGDAAALVFDYVGFPSEELSRVSARVQLPVFDLGHLALDALDDFLGARDRMPNEDR